MHNYRFLLVYPEFPETFWSFKHTLRFIGKKALMPPLGLATIAGMVGGSFDLSAVDLNVSTLSDTQILEADLILVSAMLIQKESFLQVIQRCKGLGKPVAVGGPYPTECWEELSRLPLDQRPDFLILDEGEVTFPPFLEDWKAGHPKPIYRSKIKPSLDRSPIPRFDLFDLNVYNVLPLQFSRGCPFDCEFCDIVHLFGRTPRTKNPAQFITELESALNLGFKGNVFIVDDNFIGNRKRVKELLRVLVSWQETHHYPVQFCTEASIDLAKDDELLDLMVQAGFYMVFLGLETPLEHSLKEARKIQNLNTDALESVRKIQSRGIEVTGGFIIGFDSDPSDIADRQRSFIEELAVPTAMVGLLTALPGTRLYKRLVQEGRLLRTASGNNTHELQINFLPRQPLQTLLENYRILLSEIYKPNAYFKRCLEFLNRLPEQVRCSVTYHRSRTFCLRNVRILLHSFFKQTFSWYGFWYLSYIVRAFKLHPKKIVQIVSFAVQGHHLLELTRKILRTNPLRAARAVPHVQNRIKYDTVQT
ncbi:MAG: B12-binding domain-containing radical SAM protein [Spirochaetes bacterium]|nr:B12-binding domain-containing radical SAM protein [Spirochaetota bacterium]